MPLISNFSSSSAQGYGELRTIDRVWSDNFNRATTISGLGNSADGQPWTATRGNWFINSSGQAQTNDSYYSIASTYLGTPNSSATIQNFVGANVFPSGLSGAGATFWQVDANNWYAAAVTSVTGSYYFTYTSGSYSPCATTSGGGTGTYTGVSGNSPNSCGTYPVSTPYSTTCCCTCCNAGCASTTTCSTCHACNTCYITGPNQYVTSCSYCGYTSVQCNCTTTPDPRNCSYACTGYSTSYYEYCYNSSGAQEPGNNSSCGVGYNNNVCGPVCVPSSTVTTYSGIQSVNYYQLNVLQSISGTVTLVSGITLSSLITVNNTNPATPVVTPIPIVGLEVVTSGGYATISIQDSLGPNFISSFTPAVTITGSGNLGKSSGIINVNPGVILNSSIVTSYYTQNF